MQIGRTLPVVAVLIVLWPTSIRSVHHDDATIDNRTGESHLFPTTGNTSHHSHGVHMAGWNLDYVRQPLVIAIFLIVTAVCKLGFHSAEFLSSVLPESCLLIIIGTIVGATLHFIGADKEHFLRTFSSDVFFLFLLPPIILESAYSLHDREFFDNIGTILLYAVVGTIMNWIIIGPALYALIGVGAMGDGLSISLVHCFIFSALIVAVDPVAVLAIFNEIGVNNVLYFLVFGESLLNDAVTVVIYKMMIAFSTMHSIPIGQLALALGSFFSVSLGGLGIGVIFGVFTSLLTKRTQHVQVVEPLALFTFAYTSYLVAELFHFSGIISIIGCGLTQAQYAFHNISHKSLTTVKYFSKTQSATCDCIIFLYLGLALVKETHIWHTAFVIWSIVLCLIVRFTVVYALTFLANRFNRLRIINIEEQFIMAYGGLRGAVAFSLVAMLDEKDIRDRGLFETATLAVVIFTVFVQGITIKPLVKLLRIKQNSVKSVSICEEINFHVTDHVMAGIEEILGRYGANFLREMADRFDDTYLKLAFQRDPQTKDDYIMELYEKMSLQLHYENVAGASGVDQYLSHLDLYKQPDDMPTGSPHVVNKAANKRMRQMSIAAATQIRRRQSEAGKPLPCKKFTWASRSQSLRASNVEKEEEEEDENDETKPAPRGRRKTLFDLFRSSVDEDDSSDPGIDELRTWLIVNPTKQNFHRKHDRNLTHEKDTDLLHHLHQKHLRNLRFQRSMTADYSCDISPQTSLPYGSNDASRTALNVIDEVPCAEAETMSPREESLLRRNARKLLKVKTVDETSLDSCEQEPPETKACFGSSFPQHKSRAKHLSKSFPCVDQIDSSRISDRTALLTDTKLMISAPDVSPEDWTSERSQLRHNDQTEERL